MPVTYSMPHNVPPAPRVLTVEDDGMIATDLERQLSVLGYSVPASAFSGEQALQRLETEAVDLVLMDIRLGEGMSGTEAGAAILERYQIPVVYLTGYTDASTIEQVKQSGGYGFVTKPYRPEAVDAMIHLALSVHRSKQDHEQTVQNCWEQRSRRVIEDAQHFTYAAGHDLKEPLRSARFLVDIFDRQTGEKLDEKERELLLQARTALDRLNTITDDLLRYSQAGTLSPDFELVSSEAAFRMAIANLQGAIVESRAQITSNPLPMVRGDLSQIERVFQNLIGNSIRYRQPGTAPVIHVSAEPGATECVFRVADSGIGFHPKYRDVVFRPFSRLNDRNEYPGSGIGLAICKKIIEAHGGRIWAEAVPNGGAVFSFTLRV